VHCYNGKLFGVHLGVLADTLIGAIDHAKNESAKFLVTIEHACRLLFHMRALCRMPHAIPHANACERMRASECVRANARVCAAQGPDL
jgi:hypothetical protein